MAVAEWRLRPRPAPVLLAALSIADFVLNQALEISIIATLTAATILLSTSSYGNWLNREPLSASVGRWSYSLYLLHVPVACWVLGPWVNDLRYNGALAHAGVDFVILVACICVARVSWRYVELPSSRLWRSPQFQRILPVRVRSLSARARPPAPARKS
jgi:peptidoglycan/LPS O-acetylase OafA/YrhL